MKYKIMQAMKTHDDELQLFGFVQLDDAYWGGVIKGKRGRGTGNKSPFIVEVAIMKKAIPCEWIQHGEGL